MHTVQVLPANIILSLGLKTCDLGERKPCSVALGMYDYIILCMHYRKGDSWSPTQADPTLDLVGE